ncbi:MAG: GNAT family N-acetyltransferase [Bacillota bacterium]
MPGSMDNLLAADRVDRALLRYYALFHPRELTRVRRLNGRRGRGLAVVANAGFNNVKLVTLAASDAGTARCLLYGCLKPGDRYFFVCDPRCSPWLHRFLQHRSEETLNVIAVTDRSSFRPFAAPGPDPERYQATRAHGLLPYFGYRCLHEGEPVSQAFVIWQSDRFAEIGVFTRDDFRGRGYARAVVSALTQELLDRDITPLYIYDPANAASERVCLALGYYPAGREFSCYASLPPLTPSRRGPG